MSDDFEESYDDGGETTLREDVEEVANRGKDVYDKVKDLKDSIKDQKNKKGKVDNFNQQNTKQFNQGLKERNLLRTNNPQMVNASTNGANAINTGANVANATNAVNTASNAANAVNTASNAANAVNTASNVANTVNTASNVANAAQLGANAAATTATTTTTTAATVGGAAAVDAIPVVGQVLLIIEAVILLLVAAFKLKKKFDKKMAESGIDSKGIGKLMLIAPVLVPVGIILLIILIILMLVQSETYDKVDFMKEAIVCLESENGCTDFMNTGINIAGDESEPLIKKTDLELAKFVVQYMRAENKYFGSQGSSFLDLYNEIEDMARNGLDPDTQQSTIEKIFEPLVEDGIIADARLAWNLFRWLKIEKKVYNNITWYKAYTANRFAAVTNIAAGIQTKVTGEPKIIDDDTITKSVWAVDFDPTNAYLKTPTGITVDEGIQLTKNFIPTWLEIYGTYVGTGSYKLANDIYEYYTSDEYELEVTIYQLTTVTSIEKVEGDSTTIYEVTNEDGTRQLTKAEYEAAIASGSTGLLSWLGNKLAEFAQKVEELVEDIIEAIKEFLGFYITVETDYVAVVTKGWSFNQIIEQNNKIKTDKTTEFIENAEDPKIKSLTKTFGYKKTENVTEEFEFATGYVADSNGLYAKDYDTSWNIYKQIRYKGSDWIQYYSARTGINGEIQYYNNYFGNYVKTIDGEYMQVRSASDYKAITTYSPQTRTETITYPVEVDKTAKYTVTTTTEIDHNVTKWTNKLDHVASTITEYEEMNRYAQIFTDMVEEKGYNYTLDDVAIPLEVIEYYYKETYSSTGDSVDYSALPPGQFGWPVPTNYSVSAIYGYSAWYNGDHKGIDIWPSVNQCGLEAIVAAQDGIVETAFDGGCADGNRVSTSCGGGYGNYVKLKHANGYATIYAHMSPGTLGVKVGQEVKAGQYLGRIGSSGNSSGAHLHYEIRHNEDKLDPLAFYTVVPNKYNVPYHLKNRDAITMDNPYKVVFSI